MAEQEPLGIIRVPLTAFNSVVVGRGPDGDAVRLLESAFDNESCKPNDEKNLVEGIVDLQTYRMILKKLCLTPKELRDLAKRGRYPKVTLRNCITCSHGRQRITAARNLYGESYVWAVRINFKERLPTSNHQTKWSDGEIYWNFRLCIETEREWDQQREEDLFARSLRNDLKPGKIKSLNMLLRRTRDPVTLEPRFKHEGIVKVLDLIMEKLPAMRGALQLGNWHKFLPQLCDEQIENYLQNVVNIWVAGIADHNPEILLHADLDTIRFLQFRLPSAAIDRAEIKANMDGGGIFRGLTDRALRAQVLQRILALKAIIHSMETFHKNMLYFTIGTKVLRNHILDDELKDDTSTDVNDSLFSALSKHWNPAHPELEIGNNKFHDLGVGSAYLACLTIFLLSLRHFPYYLPKTWPLQDKRGEPPMAVELLRNRYLSSLYNTARRVGLHTKKVRTFTTTECPPEENDIFAEWRSGKPWRGGKPSTVVFRFLQQTAFLPTLLTASTSDGATPTFVLKDFIEAFFGKFPWHDTNGSNHDDPEPSEPRITTGSPRETRRPTAKGVTNHNVTVTEVDDEMQDVPSTSIEPQNRDESAGSTIPPARVTAKPVLSRKEKRRGKKKKRKAQMENKDKRPRLPVLPRPDNTQLVPQTMAQSPLKAPGSLQTSPFARPDNQLAAQNMAQSQTMAQSFPEAPGSLQTSPFASPDNQLVPYGMTQGPLEWQGFALQPPPFPTSYNPAVPHAMAQRQELSLQLPTSPLFGRDDEFIRSIAPSNPTALPRQSPLFLMPNPQAHSLHSAHEHVSFLSVAANLQTESQHLPGSGHVRGQLEVTTVSRTQWISNLPYPDNMPDEPPEVDMLDAAARPSSDTDMSDEAARSSSDTDMSDDAARPSSDTDMLDEAENRSTRRQKRPLAQSPARTPLARRRQLRAALQKTTSTATRTSSRQTQSSSSTQMTLQYCEELDTIPEGPMFSDIRPSERFTAGPSQLSITMPPQLYIQYPGHTESGRPPITEDTDADPSPDPSIQSSSSRETRPPGQARAPPGPKSIQPNSSQESAPDTERAKISPDQSIEPHSSQARPVEQANAPSHPASIQPNSSQEARPAAQLPPTSIPFQAGSQETGRTEQVIVPPDPTPIPSHSSQAVRPIGNARVPLDPTSIQPNSSQEARPTGQAEPSPDSLYITPASSRDATPTVQTRASPEPLPIQPSLSQGTKPIEQAKLPPGLVTQPGSSLDTAQQIKSAPSVSSVVPGKRHQAKISEAPSLRKQVGREEEGSSKGKRRRLVPPE